MTNHERDDQERQARADVLNQESGRPAKKPRPAKTSSNFRMRSQNFLLTYKTHIDKQKVADLVMRKCSKITFVRVAWETGETGYEHTHVFAHCAAKSPDVKNERAFDFDDIHPNVSPGTQPSPGEAGKRQFDYVTKEDPDYLDCGEMPDFGDYMTKLVTLIQSQPNYGAMITHPEISAFASTRMQWVQAVWTTRPVKLQSVMKEDMSNFNPMQKTAYERLINQNDRKVLWIVDGVGGSGKSQLLKWLTSYRNAFWCDGGKYADIALAYDAQQIICFDFKRSVDADHWPYKAIEAMKDGVMFSGKYQSTVKAVRDSKIIVCSNEPPDTTKLSADRWDIITIDDAVVGNDQFQIVADQASDISLGRDDL